MTHIYILEYCCKQIKDTFHYIFSKYNLLLKAPKVSSLSVGFKYANKTLHFIVFNNTQHIYTELFVSWEQ